MFDFQNSYAELPDVFWAKQNPVPVASPHLIQFNQSLAQHLGIKGQIDDESLAQFFSGNEVPAGSSPLAMAYAGHQFGNFVPQLGDGRALLLGEVTGKDGHLYDIQLKGSGRTKFSRGGDGRSWIGPVIREYLVSEAMAAMNVPTTRALAACASGEIVYRETPLPGGVLTRVARSHMRVGTFAYFGARQDKESLRILANYAIDRLYPDAKEADNAIVALLEAVVKAQAELVSKWMLLGFIHGVMNTDNMAISGETIDYGPCAFMDEFHPNKVFSSIDHAGRYAWQNQAQIAYWNLAQLAQALLPILDEDQGKAVELAQAALDPYLDHHKTAFRAGFVAKLGLSTWQDGDDDLFQNLMAIMASNQLDWTNTFRNLATGLQIGDDALWFDAFENDGMNAWRSKWLERLAVDSFTAKESRAVMSKSNPTIIPRNHLVEKAIAAATEGDYQPFKSMLAAVTTPYDVRHDGGIYAQTPSDAERVTQTFCGT